MGKLTQHLRVKPGIIQNILKNSDLAEIVKSFIEKGGKINKNYLRTSFKGPVLVSYKHKWRRGKNLREAISRALAG